MGSRASVEATSSVVGASSRRFSSQAAKPGLSGKHEERAPMPSPLLVADPSRAARCAEPCGADGAGGARVPSQPRAHRLRAQRWLGSRDRVDVLCCALHVRSDRGVLRARARAHLHQGGAEHTQAHHGVHDHGGWKLPARAFDFADVDPRKRAGHRDGRGARELRLRPAGDARRGLYQTAQGGRAHTSAARALLPSVGCHRHNNRFVAILHHG